ncbi:protein CONSERVED ONLY IN THE GREEN LINEAGE 160 [Citrus sinensis]|uniref:Protein CONSERVED ONLY IN THE GREEN LINEAGE 160 n=1 Tax=Citrus sinensis TaxID=2711 RepID=A0ACB8N0L0_CITSI|nr:protein CONSERVED ONLY IN THE GREEN LINEAGE 160 [Citrus sinensis]
MAVLNYIPVTATSAPISQDSSSTSSSVPTTRPTKILLPKKKSMKWSTGVAPGEYGGPPTTTKLRKFWGGEKEDPLTSDEFIWNNDFMPRMKRLIEDTDESSAEKFPVQEEPSGFLSLNRVMSLDSLEVDLSKELTADSKTALQQPVEAAIQDSQQKSGSVPRKWRLAPTRREQDKWDKATKAATGGSLKSKLQFLTLGIGGVGLVSAYISYSPEIAASFAAGLLGSLVYIRMLGSTVDSMAAGAKGLMKGAVGQPRLLVPVVLVMIYNRWNEIAVPEYGFLHLELIPMLVGFFTYKIATFFQAVEEAVSIVEKKDPDIV